MRLLKAHRGYFYGMIAAFINAANAVFIKLASDVPDPTIVFFRMIFGFAAMLPFLITGKVKISKKHIPKHLLRTFLGVSSIYLFVFSVARLPLVNVLTLFRTSVLFLPLVVFFIGRKVVPRQRIIGCSIGFIGVVAVLRPHEAFMHPANLAALGAAVSVALALYTIRQLSKVNSTETILGFYYVLATPFSVFPMLWYWEPIQNPVNWIYLVILGILSIGYQFFLTKSYTHAASTKVSVLSYLAVPLSGLAGWWIWGEVPSYWIWIGAVLVILGGVIVLLDRSHSKPIAKK